MTDRRELPVAEAPDGELPIERALAGDPAAFEELVRRLQGPAWALARRIVRDRETAFEMVQEAFLKVHVHRAAFIAGQPFEPWFYRILANLCLNAARRSRLRELPSDPSELGRTAAAKEPSPQHAIESRELDRKLAIAFDRLPPRYRAAMALRVDAGFSVEQIAQALDCPTGTVKTLLFRARELMRAWSDGGRP